MATPVYNTGWRHGRGGYGHRGGYGSGRRWGVVTRLGSMLGGNTPRYLGAGQPAAEGSGSFFGSDTPVYLAMSSTQNRPSETPSATTAQPPAPQPGQMAIVVPRS